MALRVSPERVRDVRFAEQWRGYRTDEVDEFVEQVAEAFDQLERRLEEAAQRTALSERRLEERGPDEDLRRTLVLAQRTADAALEEARAEATRMVADAEEQARAIQDHLKERKARIEGEIDARVAMELAQVSDRRAALEVDVELLASYVENHRTRLVRELRAHLAWLDGTGPLEAPPASLSSPPTPPLASLAVDEDGDRAEAEPPAPGVSAEAASDARRDGVESLRNPEASGDALAEVERQEDDTVLGDLDVIPWGAASVEEASDDEGASDDEASDDDEGEAGDAGAAAIDDDPFIAELRRAVDDPEPLGPRDASAEWSDDVDLYVRHKSGLKRSRRRRRP
jgi:DivIVA domain-containing protein